MCLVRSDICVIVGFNISPQKGTLKHTLADRKERKSITLPYDVPQVEKTSETGGPKKREDSFLLSGDN